MEKAACIAERYLRRLRAGLLRRECVSVRFYSAELAAEGIRTLGQLTKGEKSVVPWKNANGTPKGELYQCLVSVCAFAIL